MFLNIVVRRSHLMDDSINEVLYLSNMYNSCINYINAVNAEARRAKEESSSDI